MKYRRIGKSGLKVSEISYGTMFFGGAQFQATDNPVTREEGLKCLKKVHELGINYIDSADIYGGYGKAEAIVGEFLVDYDRAEFVISSKLMFPMSTGVNDRSLSKKHIAESARKSLAHQKTDYLDLYYCHRYDHSTPLTETILAMNDLIENGDILYWATSNWSSAQLERAYGIAKELGLRGPICDQVKYNMYLRYGVEIELPYTVHDHGLGIVVYRVLAEGVFAGRYNVEKYEDLSDQDLKHLNYQLPVARGTFDKNQLSKLHKLEEIGKQEGLSMAQLVYAWYLYNKDISSVLMSSRKPERIEENVQAIEVNMDKDLFMKINLLLDNQPIRDKVYSSNIDSYHKYLSSHPKASEGKYPPDPSQF
ncbi:MAG: aldo/keto reductase [Candidatus Kariarchaeaceae archaeon]|jgi:aryl-alcohol dehydrogenase-like predicted oxidoreductase